MLCEKDGKKGHKWGDAGVCFIGEDSKERAAAVGAAASEGDEKEEKGVLKRLMDFLSKELGEEPKENKKDPKKKKKERQPDAGKKQEEEGGGETLKKKPVRKALDEEKRLITGVVLQPEIVDAHGDVVSKDEIENTAIGFMEDFRTIGKQHMEKAEAVPVESFIARGDMIIGDETVVDGSWVMTVKVLDDALWEEAKDGKFTGFSIGGFSKTEDL